MNCNATKTAPAKPGESVLVTGAAGCVGHLLAEELHKKGYKLLLTDVPRANMSLAESDNVKIIKGDLTNEGFIKELFAQPIDHVLHLAAWVDIGKNFEQLAPINFYAVRNLYRIAAQKGVKRFIHYSTGSMYKKHYGPIHEEYPAEPSNAYARTKLMADDFLLSQSEEGPKVTIIRPALIFGPRGKVLAATMATMPGILKLFSGTSVRFSGGPRSNWVHALDMALGTIHLLEMEIPNKEIYNIANNEATPVGEAFSIALETGDVKLIDPAVPYPGNIIEALLPVITLETNFAATNFVLKTLWSRVVEKHGLVKELEPQVDKEAMAFATHDTIFDNSKIRNAGYVFRYPDFRSGWEATVNWYIENKWVPNFRGE